MPKEQPNEVLYEHAEQHAPSSTSMSDSPEEKRVLAKGLKDLHARSQVLLRLAVHAGGGLVGYTVDDVAKAMMRTTAIMTDRSVARSPELSQQDRELAVGTIRNLATSFHVEGRVSPTVESLTSFLLGAFSYLPDDWNVEVNVNRPD